jgi:hypothetical protein
MPKLLNSFENDVIDYDMGPTPQQLLEIYNNGFQGVRSDPTAYYAMRTKTPRFYDEFPQAKGSGAGKISLPFRAALSLDEGFGSTEAQQEGSCVSFSTRNAGMIDYCIDAMFGETEYKGRLATENIYGYRGHSGQGASCARLAEYVSQNGPGGFLVRGKYKSEDGRYEVDLSKYNGKIGTNWGGSGTPSWLNKIAAQNKALRVFNIKSVEEARDCIAAGFGLSVCSGYGFTSTRDKNGVSEASGSWSHATSWVGVNDTDWAHQNYGGCLFLYINSWGSDWNSGPKTYDQPDGSFWIRPKVAAGMIAGGGAWAIASVRGYNRELVYDMSGKIMELSNEF